MNIDGATIVLWTALGVWCVIWLNVAVDAEPDARGDSEKFDDMAW